jgi:hypothetical protein
MTWTDEDLFSHSFTIEGRPDTDPAVTAGKPSPSAKFTFTRSYNIAPPRDLPNRRDVQPYVWCALCQEPTHWKGWESEIDEDGARRLVLIGETCATRKGGEIVKAAARTFNARRARADVLRARSAILPVLPSVNGALLRWRTDAGVLAVSAWRTLMRSWLPGERYQHLQQAARGGPPVLQVPVFGRRNEPPSGYKSVGALACVALYNGRDPQSLIDDLTAKLAAARLALEGTDDASTASLKAILRRLRDVTDGADEIEQRFTKLAAGLSEQSVDMLFEWSNESQRAGEYGQVKLGRSGRRVVLMPQEGKPMFASIPTMSPIVHPPELDQLSQLLTTSFA